MEENKFKITFENDKPKIDKELCLSIVCADIEPQTKDDKYSYHLALDFFKNNFLNFSQEEVQNVCSHPYAVKRLGGNFDITALQLCVKKGEAFPVALTSWAGKKIKRNLLIDYVNIVEQNGDIQQMKFFIEHFQDAMIEYIDEHRKISPALHESIAQYIFEQKNKEELSNILNILGERSSSILIYLQKNHEKEFRELLGLEFQDPSNSKANINFAQHLILSKKYNSLNTINEIFSSHKDILLQPVQVVISLYTKDISIFEYALTQSKLTAFAPFNLNDNLEAEHKEQIVSAAFSLIQYNNDAYKHHNHGSFYTDKLVNFDEVLKYWYPSIIEQATNEQVNYYAEFALEGHENNSKLKKEIDSILLVKDLNAGLSENQNSSKKLKI